MQATIKERPILFSAPMVNAILEGRKTQTRRIIKQQPSLLNGGHWYVPFKHELNWIFQYILGDKIYAYAKFPYGKVGDRLWVRESVSVLRAENGCDCSTESGNDFDWGFAEIKYISDGEIRQFHELYDEEDCQVARMVNKKTVPSIFMPRWASRITLEITNIRAERLNDISESDCEKEGAIDEGLLSALNANADEGYPIEETHYLSSLAKEKFAELWESINGKSSWNDNPYVWIIEFKRVEQPK